MPLLRRIKQALPPIFTPTSARAGQVPAVSTSQILPPEQPSAEPAQYSGMRAAAQWSWQFLVIAAAGAVVLYGIVQVSIVVVPLLLAALVTALLLPVSSFFHEKLHFPRTIAVISTLLLGIGGAGGLLFVVVRELIDEIPALYRSALAGFSEVLTWLVEGPLRLDQTVLNEYWNSILRQIEANVQVIITGALSFTSSLGSVVSSAFITLFCLYFFLCDGRKIWAWIVHLVPRPMRPRIHGAGIRSWMSVGAYARTQILVAFVDAVGIGAGAAILQIPLALPIAVLVFLGSFIPIVGAVATGAIAIAVALVDQGVVGAAIMLAIVLGVQQIEGNLLQPLLMGRALRLHPVAVLLSVVAGTYLAGIIGALVAVPILAVVNTATKYLVSGEDPPMGVNPDLIPTPVSPPSPMEPGSGPVPHQGAYRSQASGPRSEGSGQRSEGSGQRSEAGTSSVLGTAAGPQANPVPLPPPMPGVAGPAGAVGVAGAAGVIGPTGVTGTASTAGPTGAAGRTGPTGPAGSTNTAAHGSTHPPSDVQHPPTEDQSATPEQ